MVDIDGVISLFGGAEPGAPTLPVEGSFHSIEGIPHFLSATAAGHLLELASLFDLVWASGWEERADEHLPHLLGLPARLPHLSFEHGVPRRPGCGGREPVDAAGRRDRAHWKLAAIEAYAGARALAWVDDAHDDACRRWADAREAPTLLVATDPQRGLTASETQTLAGWARALARA